MSDRETLYHVLDLSEETKQWFKSDEGIVFLSDCWTASLAHLRRIGVFDENPNEYKELKNGSLLAGFKVIRKCEYWDFGAIPGQPSTIPSQSDETFVFDLTLGFHFRSKAREGFERMSAKTKNILGEKVFYQLLKSPVLQASRSGLKTYVPSLGASYEPIFQEEWVWYMKGEEGVCTEFKIASSDQEFTELTGRPFKDIFTLLRNPPDSVVPVDSEGGSTPEASTRTKGVRGGWERKLSQYLLAENFIVLTEPEIDIPNYSGLNWREPDLLVNTRVVIAIEIDDCLISFIGRMIQVVVLRKVSSINSDGGKIETWIDSPLQWNTRSSCLV